MGFLNIFKKKEKNTVPQYTNQQRQESPFNFSITPNGLLKVDFVDPTANFAQAYDTTSLLVNPNPMIMDNQEVYNCAVRYWGSNWAIITGVEEEYTEVLAQINLPLLQTNSDYCMAVMKKLLNKERVEKYLKDGLQETPECPCGKYIGGIKLNDFGKFFSLRIGELSHYSNSMVKQRQEHRMNLEYKKQQSIADKQRQIKQLQDEIDNMR